MSDTSKIYLTFRLADQWYGMDVNHIIEVLWLVYLEELPATKPDVLGLLNLHNMTMPVIDLRKRFALIEEPTHLYTPLVATQIDDRMMAFVVDEVKDVIEIDKHQLREAHESPFIKHIVELNDYLLRILDIESTIVNINNLSNSIALKR